MRTWGQRLRARSNTRLLFVLMVGILWVATVALSLPLTACAAAASVALHIRLEGVINPVKARYVQQGFERAHALNARFVLVSLNTPGGLVSSMEEISSTMTNESIPVVGFVHPATAQATSAGAFILLSTDVAAMAPGTRVGAAHPVGQGRPLEGPIDAKATNSLVSLAKSLASRHHRSEAFAESIVRDSSSLTAEEAQKANAIELIAVDVPELMTRLSGYHVSSPNKDTVLDTKDITIVEFPLSASNKLLDRLSDPTLASIFLTLGMLGILFELKSPGLGVSGIIGATSLVLALVGASTLPLSIGGVALVLLGIGALALEVKASAHGALALGGLLALVLGVVVLIDESAYFGNAQRASLRVVVPTLLITAVTFAAFAAAAARALRAPPRSGVEAMTGMLGHARSDFTDEDGHYRGMVFVDGARWTALAEEPVGNGDEVIVDRVLSRPARLHVHRSKTGGT